jgi:hypothetical protein
MVCSLRARNRLAQRPNSPPRPDPLHRHQYCLLPLSFLARHNQRSPQRQKQRSPITIVSKTTTLAKLAARYSVQHRLPVALITADTFRIGAVGQLRTYSDLSSFMAVLPNPHLQIAVAAGTLLADAQRILERFSVVRPGGIPQLLQKAVQEVDREDPQRLARVAQLREQVQNDTYQVPAQLAARMMSQIF